MASGQHANDVKVWVIIVPYNNQMRYLVRARSREKTIVPMPSSIAIDGPAAAGKTTIAKELAEKLGYIYFDTGLMYRAATYCAFQENVNLDDEADILAALAKLEMDVQQNTDEPGNAPRIVLGGKDVTSQLRTPQVDEHVSQISAYPGVRRILTEKQREIGQRGQIVMVGRDIGTVVMPDADLKIYMDASVEARAKRRFVEFEKQGKEIAYEDILATTKQRDLIDSERAIAPLKAAEDAIVIDTTEMDKDEVLHLILDIVRQQSVN